VLPLETYCLLVGYSSISNLSSTDYLFYRDRHNKDKPMSRQWAWRIISFVARENGLQAIGTHSMRKNICLRKISRDRLYSSRTEGTRAQET
jgi:site-specific recombinase XerD